MNAIREIAEGMAANVSEIDRKMRAPATVKWVNDPRYNRWIKKTELDDRNAYEAIHGQLDELGDGRMREEDRDHYIAFCEARHASGAA